MKWNTVLFDFDGTVFDTVDGITKSVQYALKKHGIEEETEALRCFAGPPLVDMFMEKYNVSKAEAEQLVKDFRERYVPVGVYESSPFPGIAELMRRLKDAGICVAVATSKPQAMAELLLERSGMRGLFDAVVGSQPGLNNDRKSDIIRKTIDVCGKFQLNGGKMSAVMIGDTKYDAIGAEECGLPCIGAGWGYAAEGEMDRADVACIADTVEELLSMLL